MAKNFSYSLVATAPSPATTGTSLVVTGGDGTLFPPVPFQATVWPTASRPTASNAEIVTVTAVSTDTLTIVRAQEGSSARTVVIGDQIAATVTAGVIVQSNRYNPTTPALQNITLDGSADFTATDALEVGSGYSLEVPATSTLEIVPTVKQTEVQSYFGVYDFIESGCVWSADNAGSSLNGTMTDGYVWINGRRLRVNAVRSHAFTASKDTYVDFSDNGDGTAKLTYTENTNNLSTGSPTLAAGSLRNAIIVTAAGSIAAATSINQGQETIVLPIVSSVAYSVTDSLGNLICPRDPNRKILGYAQSLADYSTATTTVTDVTALQTTVNVPTGRKVKVTAYTGTFYSTAVSGTSLNWTIREGSTQLAGNQYNQGGSQFSAGQIIEYVTTPSAGVHTYKASVIAGAAGTIHATASSTAPQFIKVELV